MNLDLNYGSAYYLDLSINGTDLDFDSNERKRFISSVGQDANISNLLTQNGRIALTIANNANIGIGQTNPQTKLNVVGDVNFSAAGTGEPSIFTDTAALVGINTSSPTAVGAGYGTLDIQGSSGGGTRFGVTEGNEGITYATANGTYLGSVSNVNTYIISNNQNKIAIEPGGDVGIATNKPNNTLNVVGDINFDSDGTGNPEFFVNSSTHRVGIGTASPAGLFEVSGDLIVSQTDGNVGINLAGAEAPIANFVVYDTGRAEQIIKTASDATGSEVALSFVVSSGGGVRGFSNRSADIKITRETGNMYRMGFFTSDGTNNTEKMTIIGDGNVGIGESSPTSLLHIKTAATDTNALSIVDSSDADLFRFRTDGNVTMKSPDGTSFNCGVTNGGTFQCT